jgi:hypothetical protein
MLRPAAHPKIGVLAKRRLPAASRAVFSKPVLAGPTSTRERPTALRANHARLDLTGTSQGSDTGNYSGHAEEYASIGPSANHRSGDL